MKSTPAALALTTLLALVAACSAPPSTSGGANAASQAPGGSGGASFSTGPAVLVAEGYQAPKDRVDTTGAFLPANGKPTIVWVDAIW